MSGRSTLGIIGVGEIAAAVVDGILGGETREGLPQRVLLSPRGRATSEALAQRYDAVSIAEDNQQVVDGAQVLLLAVRPEQATRVLAELDVPADRLLISAVAQRSVDELSAAAPGVRIVRSIPMPAVRQRQGATALFPGDAGAVALFDALGSCVIAGAEQELEAMSVISAGISSGLGYLAELAGWLEAHQVAADRADRYVRSLFLGLGGALADQDTTLPALVAAHETPGGLNEYRSHRLVRPAPGRARPDAGRGARPRPGKGGMISPPIRVDFAAPRSSNR